MRICTWGSRVRPLGARHTWPWLSSEKEYSLVSPLGVGKETVCWLTRGASFTMLLRLAAFLLRFRIGDAFRHGEDASTLPGDRNFVNTRFSSPWRFENEWLGFDSRGAAPLIGPPAEASTACESLSDSVGSVQQILCGSKLCEFATWLPSRLGA